MTVREMTNKLFWLLQARLKQHNEAVGYPRLQVCPHLDSEEMLCLEVQEEPEGEVQVFEMGINLLMTLGPEGGTDLETLKGEGDSDA